MRWAGDGSGELAFVQSEALSWLKGGGGCLGLEAVIRALCAVLRASVSMSRYSI